MSILRTLRTFINDFHTARAMRRAVERRYGVEAWIVTHGILFHFPCIEFSMDVTHDQNHAMQGHVQMLFRKEALDVPDLETYFGDKEPVPLSYAQVQTDAMEVLCYAGSEADRLRQAHMAEVEMRDAENAALRRELALLHLPVTKTELDVEVKRDAFAAECVDALDTPHPLAVRVKEGHCSRCGKKLEYYTPGSLTTLGYYNVAPQSNSWSEFARAGETLLCDHCMWDDPKYIARYGRMTAGVKHDAERGT